MDHRCPKKLKEYPTTPCSEGKKAIDAERKGQTGGCPWFINDRDSCFCFFKAMEGGAAEMSTPKIAQLTMMDDSEVKKIIQNFRRRIPQLFNVRKASDLLIKNE